VISEASVPDRSGTFSVVLIDLDFQNAFGRTIALQKEVILRFRNRLQAVLREQAMILLYNDSDLLVLLPETLPEHLPARLRTLREVFSAWNTIRVRS